MNKLECPLCQEPFNQPNMCPHCSQVYCLRCIRSYLNQYYFCPSCDHHVIDLIDCQRLINQVKEKIKQSDHNKNSQKQNSNRELCPEHSLPLQYHCQSCVEDICSDCGLISIKHKNHIIQPIQMVKPSKNVVSRSQLKQIKLKIAQKLLTARQQQKKYYLELQLLKSQIKYNKTKIYDYYQQLILRLQKQAQLFLKDIETRIHECTKNISQKSGIKEKIQIVEKISFSQQKLKPSEQQQDNSSASVQIKDKQLYKYLLDNNYLRLKQADKREKQMDVNKRKKNIIKQQSLNEKEQSKFEESQQFSQMSLLFDKKIYESGVMKQIYPEYHNFSFELDYTLQKDQEIAYSSNFKVFGYEWRLKIYPQGNSQAFNEYVSVFLQLINSPEALTRNSPRQYFFRLELLNLNQAGKSVIKQYNSKFSVGQCWGYAQYTPLNEIKDYLHDGKLLFVVGIKNVSYYDLCENMQKYVVKLQGENKVLSQLCENYYLGNHNNVPNNINSQLSINSGSSSQNSANHHNIGHQDDISSIISSFQDD